MKAELLREIVSGFNSVKIAVVGDFCLDAYWFVDESRSEVSIETGHKTMPVRRQKYSLGGAGNVANNLAVMEIKEVRALGVIGDDPFGPKMVDLMEVAGINTDNLLIQKENWATHVYIKPYIDENEQNRIDFGNFNVLSEDTADLLINRLENCVPQVDLVIINQQVLSGIHTEYFKKKLVKVINHFPGKIFIADSRNYTDHYTGAYRKMNDIEASLQCGIKRDPDDIPPHTEVISYANILFKRYRKPLFITRGKRGSMAMDEKGFVEIPGLMIISKVDTVGAGDSFLAGVASTLAAGYSIENAAEIGGFVAGVTVQKLFQTGTASPSEILKIGEDHDFIYRPELAEDPAQALYLNETGIEIAGDFRKDIHITHAIFDHDGTISTLREGWEKIIAPMMIRVILGDKVHEADKSLYHKVEAQVREFIDKTTGIQTLMQMKLLLDIIKEFGFVPENKMTDEFGYKEIYNNDLLLMVREREKKLKNGEFSVEDLTIKNALPFIHSLHDAGVILYLASGTDEADVRYEAETLGYDWLFKGGIYGAVGDINKEPKKMVLDRILDMVGGTKYDQIATFGDGPVEIRETHKRGGITIGVASDEVNRSGLNHTKRERLIKAGADIIIPDFTRSDELIKLLNIK